MNNPIPPGWTPPAKMSRIIVHWTAGGHKATEFDRKHYHLLVEGDGTLVRGRPSIAANEAPLGKGYAAHTLNCNSGAIGVALCCMAGAKERPFDPGRAPMTAQQWNAMVDAVAQLCKIYGIPPNRETLLSHAEVEKTLGKKQRGKWDISRLAFNPKSPTTAEACGEILRNSVLAVLKATLPMTYVDARRAPPPARPGQATVARVQERLAALGYHEVGSPDGLAGKRTGAAILAFRNDHGLPLSTAIDDRLLAALMTAAPRAVDPERAMATAGDLRAQGSTIMAGANTQKIMGAAAATGAAAEGARKTGLIDVLTGAGETAGQAVEALSPFQSLMAILGDWIWLGFAAIGAVVLWQGIRIARARLADHRSGKTPLAGGGSP